MQSENSVMIVGGGVTGLSAALALSQLNIRSLLIEKSASVGGLAGRFACKATDACVKCGACLVQEKIERAGHDPNIDVHTRSRIVRVSRAERFTAAIEREVEPGKITMHSLEAAAVILACGFKPFDPRLKPYGYRHFPNVITNLDLEKMLRRENAAGRPSDGAAPRRLAFVQCVGSRDAKLGHLWCSKVCCASALRMARLIKMRRPETEISFFYIDVQTFGKTFQHYYDDARKEIHMIRAIPGDVYPAADDRLKIIYYDPETGQGREALFDMLVLSVGMTPSDEIPKLASLFDLKPEASGFMPGGNGGLSQVPGVFAAGAACGPAGIAEAVAQAQRAALTAAAFIRGRARPQKPNS